MCCHSLISLSKNEKYIEQILRKSLHIDETCYVMSLKHMIMDYGRVWISAHVGVCSCACTHMCYMPISLHDCF